MLQAGLLGILILGLWYLRSLEWRAAGQVDREAMYQGFRRLTITAGIFSAVVAVLYLLMLAVDAYP